MGGGNLLKEKINVPGFRFGFSGQDSPEGCVSGLRNQQICYRKQFPKETEVGMINLSYFSWQTGKLVKIAGGKRGEGKKGMEIGFFFLCSRQNDCDDVDANQVTLKLLLQLI